MSSDNAMRHRHLDDVAWLLTCQVVVVHCHGLLVELVTWHCHASLLGCAVVVGAVERWLREVVVGGGDDAADVGGRLG